jgi:hypothetical protein
MRARQIATIIALAQVWVDYFTAATVTATITLAACFAAEYATRPGVFQ